MNCISISQFKAKPMSHKNYIQMVQNKNIKEEAVSQFFI